jgi:triphosphatase
LHDELAALERDLERPADDAQRARRFLSRRLDKRRRRTLRHFEAVLRKDLPELHRLRKQLKKLRYTAELARSLYPARAERARKFLRSLGELQDILGALVDAQVAHALLESLRAPQPLRLRLTTQLAQHEAASLAELEAGFQQFADAKPFWS